MIKRAKNSGVFKVDAFLRLKHTLTAHNWQKWKSIYIPHMSLPLNLQGRSGWSKKFQLYFQNYEFCENVKFGAISLKIDILHISACLKFESKSSFAHMWHTIIVIIWRTPLSFQLNRFSVKYRFPFPILCFLPQNHLALLKDRFLKKMLLKRTKKPSSFFRTGKTI